MINKFPIFNFQFAKQKKVLGFTLLEILVVISIISILVALGATSYSTAQKKGRDAKRKGDLRSIGAALEQYYAVCGNQYPASLSGSVICMSPSIAILPTTQFPQEPKGTPYYTSPSQFSTTSYSACAVLESETPTQYCVINQQ